jgi:hypothetical protein
MNPAENPPKRWTASELRKLPADQRAVNLEAAVATAEQEYCNNPDLTAFEAFGKDHFLLIEEPDENRSIGSIRVALLTQSNLDLRRYRSGADS